VGGAVSANIVIGYVVDSAGWDAGFSLIAGACVVAVFLISLTFRAEHRALGELSTDSGSET
jgi:OPA family glycerol-3-phosphate transporter-like MFS transporter